MKNRWIIISGILCSGLVWSGCEKLLDIPQQGVLSLENYYQTDEEATAAVMQCYYQWQYGFTGEYNMYNSLSDDLWSGGGSRTENANLNEYYFDESFAGIFADRYKMVYYANLVLENVAPDSDAKRLAIAEAHFFRAWAYFDLVMWYGTPPLVLETLTDPDNYAQPNGDTEKIWETVFSDYNAAIDANILPSKADINDIDGGIRLTREAAYAYLGKAYLFHASMGHPEDYGKAETALKKVIDSGKYELGGIENFENLGHVAGDKSPEYIFATRGYQSDETNALSIYGYRWLFYGWRFQGQVAVMPGSKFYYYGQGYGYLQGCQKGLYDEFEEGDLRRDLTVMTFQEAHDRYTLYIQPGSAVQGVEGYMRIKNILWASDDMPLNWFVWYMTGSKASQPEMRLANVYLMYAEACIQQGKTDGNIYIDAVRDRAGLGTPPLGYTMDEIIHERRVELACENARYLDLLRWGLCEQYLGNQGSRYPIYRIADDGSYYVDWQGPAGVNYGWKKGKHELLPFPKTEREVNLQLVQNPGWEEIN